MKKIAFLLLCIFISFNLYSKTINDSQIIPSNSFIYRDFLNLQSAAKRLVFTNNTPLSVGELKFYLNQFDYDSLSDDAKTIYDSIEEFLYEKDNIMKVPDFTLALHPQINIEGYYKSNDDIPYSFNYFFNDNFITMPIDMGFGNNFAMGANFFLGKSYIKAARNSNHCNVPVEFNPFSIHSQADFYFPTFAYAGFGKYHENWGYNVHIARQGKTVGNTMTGSIIYNSTFETDAYVEFDIYSKVFKYTVDVVQVSSNRMDNLQKDNTERYLYLHQLEVNIFKNLKFSLLEGSLVASPFSLRFLNPLPFMHQSGGWKDYMTQEEDDLYGESHFCADFAYMLEYIPVPNLRIYGLYNQIELQTPWERGHDVGRYFPNSIGLQLGTEYNFIFNEESNLLLGLEGFYNSPYMYLKQTPSSSLYRARLDMQTKEYVYSWIGSPYGPDAAGGMFKASYNINKKWNTEFAYTFVSKGEKWFPIVDKYKPTDEYYDYYPSVKYILKHDKQMPVEESDDELYEDALNMLPSGVIQYTHQIKLKSTYCINSNIEFAGQFIFNYIINNGHIKNNNDSGVELDLAVKYKFL